MSESPPDADNDEDDGTGASKADALKQALAQKWLAEIAKAKKALNSYWERCDKIQKIYTEARKEAKADDSGSRNFSILWANQCVLQPAVYAQTPKPVVQRRYRDRDPVARRVCDMQERALEYNFDKVNLDETLRAVRDDFLLFARGCAWVRYDATFTKKPSPADPTQTIEAVDRESVPVDHVHYRDFIHPKVRAWNELPWVARRVYLDRKQVTNRFSKQIADCINYDHKSEDDDGTSEAKRKATVYEIWSKTDRKCIWVAEGYDKALDYADPHLTLEGFWPCPKPAFGTLATNTLVPVPDYVYYQDQAEEIDDLTAKIAELVDSLKLVGFYPGGPSEDGADAIELALNSDTKNKLIKVPSWAAFSDKGGASQIQWLPVKDVVAVLQACFETRKQLIEDVYQITGISDIVRGESDPRETAKAQNLKSQWGSIRIRDRQTEMARFARDLCRIIGEIIADKFQPETLMEMTGLHLPTEEEVDAQYQAQVAQWKLAQAPQMGAPMQPQPGMM